MSVIINEFEVVVEPPAESAANQPTPTESAPTSLALTPQDIRDIIRHQAERRARIRAH